MSKVRNLPEVLVLDDADLIYAVDMSAGPNAGAKATIATLRTAVIAQSQDIPYNNNNSTLTSTNVKAAIDELDGKVNDHSGRHLPDNSDGLTTAAPDTDLSPATSNSIGVANAYARSNHTHAVSTALVSDITSILPDDSASAGIAANFARGDHKHSIFTAAPTTNLSPATTNSEGIGSSFSRNDHTHAIESGLVGDLTTIQPDDAASAGTVDRFARADHRHAIIAAAPSNTGTANSEGASTSFARADHIHNTVIGNSIASATADDTTASLTDVLIVGMTLTPAAGTYLALFSTSVVNSGNGASRLFVSIYSGGVQVAHSEREIGISGAANTAVNSSAIVTVNGAEAIEARWRAVAGTNTAHERSLILIRLG